MNKAKKIFIAFFIGLFVVSVIVYFLKSEISDTETRHPLPQPNIPVQIEGALPLAFEIDSNDFNFPSELSLLSITPEEISLDKIKEIASNLGFTTEPNVFKDKKEGNKYYWTDGDVFFLVTPKTNTIKHGKSVLPKAVQNKQLSNDDYVRLGTEFLKDVILIPEEQIKFSDIIFLEKNPRSDGFIETPESVADIIQVNFTHKISDYEILTLEPSKPLIFIQFLKDGSIYNTEIISLGKVTKSENLYQLKSYEDVKNSLDQAILIHLLNDYINISDLSSDLIKKINIEEISLVYLRDKPSTNTLQPVFLLEGKASVAQSSANWAQLYLPAIKSQ